MELKYRVWDSSKNRWVYWSDPSFVPEPFILQLWTGMEDANGTEIYDGDIVFDNQGGWPQLKNNACIVDLDPYSPHFFFHEFGYGGGCVELNLKDRLEVIGNVFENEDLVKEFAKQGYQL